MNRRVCLTAIANEYVQAFTSMLRNINVAAKQEVFHAPITIMRLEGCGLPEWCEEPSSGNEYQWVTTAIGNNGIVIFSPIQSLAKSVAQQDLPKSLAKGDVIEWLKKQLGNPN